MTIHRLPPLFVSPFKAHIHCFASWNLLVVCLCFLFPNIGATQTPVESNSLAVKVENGIRLSKTNGLPSNAIRCIEETEDGFIWIGTTEGLCRFDGTQFKVFNYDPLDSTSIYDDRITGLLVDDQKMWVGTHLGLSVMNLQTEEFKNYQFANFQLQDTLSKKMLTRIMSFEKGSDGDIWIGTYSDGIFRYVSELDSFISYHYPREKVAPYFPTPYRIDHIMDLEQDQFNDSIIWAGTTAGLLRVNAVTDEMEWLLYPMKEEKTFLTQNVVRSIYQHSDGELYLTTWHDKVNIFNPRTAEFRPISLENESEDDLREGYKLLSSSIAPILPKNENEIWIRSSNGLMTYNIQTSSWTDIHWHDINEEKIYGPLFIDSKNRAWTPTGHGLYFFDPMQQQFIEFDFGEYHDDFMGFSSFILEESSTGDFAVMPKSSDGIFELNVQRRRWEKFQIPANFRRTSGDFGPTGYDYSPSGAWTISSVPGVFNFHPQLGKMERIEVPATLLKKYARSVLWDHSGRLWLGTEGEGLLRWTPAQNKWEVIDKELETDSLKTAAGTIPGMFEDSQKNIWIRRNLGFSVYLSKQDTFLNFVTSEQPATTIHPAHTFVEDHDGRIWISSVNGVLAQADVLHPEKGIVKKYDQLFNRLLYLQIDTSGMLWGLGDGVLHQIDPNSLATIQHSLDYGATEDIYTLRILADNRIVIGGQNKIWVADPQDLRPNLELPAPYFTKISVLQEPLNSDTAIHLLNDLYLDYEENFFSFEFSSIGFTSGAENTFRFRLMNFEDNWTNTNERRFANFTNVPPGDYIFQLQAANNEGLWNDEIKSLHVHIATPWWRTIWFLVLLVSAILGLTYLIYNWRTSQIRREERLRSDYERKLSTMEMSALRAQMNPHFIFNAMNSIEYFIIKNEPEKATDYLNRFSRLIRLILQNSKNTIVPLKDDLEALKLYLEIESMRFDDLFEYDIKVDKNLSLAEIKVPPMLMQPYIENAIWHGLLQKKGKGGKIELTLRKDSDNGSLICLIEDNGIGRAAAEKLKSKSGTRKKSFGMKITSDRLDTLNQLAGTKASVHIFDLKDKTGAATGTRVELIIPV